MRLFNINYLKQNIKLKENKKQNFSKYVLSVQFLECRKDSNLVELKLQLHDF